MIKVQTPEDHLTLINTHTRLKTTHKMNLIARIMEVKMNPENKRVNQRRKSRKGDRRRNLIM
jgi:hypothetical protein